MSRRITHDGRGVLQVRFPFDRSLVDRFKTLPHRRWNASERYWWVPDTDVVLLVELLIDDNFSLDDATRELYASMGGKANVEDRVVPATGPSTPGLFDFERTGPAVEPANRTAAREACDLTVGQLNERVSAVIESTFPAPVWVVGEISNFNKNAHRRHVGFELVDRTERGDTLSKVPATLFESTRKTLDGELRDAGDPFRLEDEISVRMRVRVELYVPWGQYRVVVEGLDLNYTLGEAARRREEIVRKLTESGLLERNSALPLPSWPLRVGLITSLGSDAYNDVMRTLQESGFAFEVTAHGARVQGHSTEPSVLNALDWFRDRIDRFDLLLICRGGGSRTDLVWFDSLALGEAVATFPLPVLVGIGHEQDQSVLDAVARSSKTPTAAAAVLVDTVHASRQRLEQMLEAILERAARNLQNDRQRNLERARRLTHAARHRVRHELTALTHRRVRTVRGATTLLAQAGERLARWSTVIPRHAALHLVRQRGAVDGLLRGVQLGARRHVQSARERLAGLGGSLAPAGLRAVRLESERTSARDRRLRLVDPRRVLERGYAILRGGDGKVLTRAREAPAGEALRAVLREGELRLRSEGEIRGHGGE